VLDKDRYLKDYADQSSCSTTQVHPCRAALDKIFSRHPTITADAIQTPQDQTSYHDEHDDDESREQSRNGDSQLRLNAPVPRQEEMSIQKLCILTALILISSFLIALGVDDLGLILGFVGSVGSTSISFIVSTLMFLVAQVLPD
jgi:hypothetical protein